MPVVKHRGEMPKKVELNHYTTHHVHLPSSTGSDVLQVMSVHTSLSEQRTPHWPADLEQPGGGTERHCVCLQS